MKFMREKVSYLKGMVEGMKLDQNTNEGMLLKAIIDVLDDFALALDDILESQEELSEQVDALDQDLSDIENLVYDIEDESLSNDDSCYVRIKCPNCSQEIEFDACELEDGDQIECPYCKENIDVELECCCDEDDSESDEDE